LQTENVINRLANYFCDANIFSGAKIHQEYEYRLHFSKFKRIYAQNLKINTYTIVDGNLAGPSAHTRMIDRA
jgi:hypothetical protein